MKLIRYYPHLAIIALIYVITAKGHIEITDTEYSIRTALSIVENGTLLIDPPYKRPLSSFPESGTPGKIYSPYGIGLSIIFIPYILLSKVISYLTNIDTRLIICFIISFHNIPFALLGLYFFQKIAQHIGATKNKAILMTVCLGVGTIYWKYTVTDFSEITQTCLLLAILHEILKNKDKMWTNISFLYSILILIKLTYFIFFPLLVIYFIYSNKNIPIDKIKKRFLQSCYFIIPTCLIIALSNYLKFQNIFESGYGRIINFSIDHLIRDWADYIHSYDKGVVTFNPILILASYSIILQICKRNKTIIAVAIIALIWYLTMCFWVSIKGGYCWGNRLLVPIVPLLLLPMVFLKIDKVYMKILLFFTLIGSTIIQFAGSFTKVHEIIEIKLNIQQLYGQNPISQLWLGIKLFFLKIKSPNVEYLASSFGVENTEVINLSSFSTFHGFNLWFVHLLNHIGLNTYSHYAGIFLLLIIIALCLSLFRIPLTNDNFVNKRHN